MAHQLQLTKAAERDLLALPRQIRRRIDEALLALAEEPRPDGVVKLKGTKGDRWRVRVGNYRILYAINDAQRVVEIARLLDRKEAYRAL